MAGTYKRELLSEGDYGLMARVLGEIAYQYAFISEPIYKLEIAAQTILSFLLERFVGAAIAYDSLQPMTDSYAKRLYQELSGIV